MGFSATIQRPSYCINNEHMITNVILGQGGYSELILQNGNSTAIFTPFDNARGKL